MMAEERRLAICIKGGVSLGAYEAGVLAKSLELIANNNSRNPIKWYVDTLAGASAGSMTAVATTCTLLDSASNYLYRMWVEKAALSTLTPDPAGVPAYDGYKTGDNLLAASALDTLAADFDTPPRMVTNRHPAMRPGAASIRLSFSLSNINGTPNRVDTLNDIPLVFREYADAAVFQVSVDGDGKAYVSGSDTRAVGAADPGDDSATAWHAMVRSAIASGSFPVAFSPRGLWRWHQDRREYTAEYYADGGLFDNDPVGKLINLAHDTDWSPANPAFQDNERRFLVVHTAAADLSDRTISAGSFYPTLDLNPIDLAQKLVPAFMDESMQSGLRGITTVNRQFANRMVVLNRLARLASTSPTPPSGSSALAGAISALAELRGFSADQIDRLRGFLVPDLEDTDPVLYKEVAGLAPAARAMFEDWAIFFDLAFNIADKIPIKPILIAPAPDEKLSGDPLFAFAGFFSKILREFDFARGQYDAFQAWEAVSKSADHDFTIEGADRPEPVGNPEPDTGAPSSSNEYDRGLRVFRDRIKVVLDRAIDELKGQSGPAARIGLGLLQMLANLGVDTIGS